MRKGLATLTGSSIALVSVRIRLLVLIVIVTANTGCSVYMAAKQPEAKDLSVLAIGNHRSRVIAELGAPIWTGEKDGDKTDVFVFKHGYGAGSRTALSATADR